MDCLKILLIDSLMSRRSARISQKGSPRGVLPLEASSSYNLSLTPQTTPSKKARTDSPAALPQLDSGSEADTKVLKSKKSNFRDAEKKVQRMCKKDSVDYQPSTVKESSADACKEPVSPLLAKVPGHILQKIFIHIPLIEMVRLRRVCHHFNSLVKSTPLKSLVLGKLEIEMQLKREGRKLDSEDWFKDMVRCVLSQYGSALKLLVLSGDESLDGGADEENSPVPPIVEFVGKYCPDLTNLHFATEGECDEHNILTLLSEKLPNLIQLNLIESYGFPARLLPLFPKLKRLGCSLVASKSDCTFFDEKLGDLKKQLLEMDEIGVLETDFSFLQLLFRDGDCGIKAVKQLYLSSRYTKDWSDENSTEFLNYCRNFPGLEGLYVRELTISDGTFFAYLPDKLSVLSLTECKFAFDGTLFPEHQIAKSLSRFVDLTHISVDQTKLPDFSFLANLPKLTSICHNIGEVELDDNLDAILPGPYARSFSIEYMWRMSPLAGLEEVEFVDSGQVLNSVVECCRYRKFKLRKLSLIQQNRGLTYEAGNEIQMSMVLKLLKERAETLESVKIAGRWVFCRDEILNLLSRVSCDKLTHLYACQSATNRGVKRFLTRRKKKIVDEKADLPLLVLECNHKYIDFESTELVKLGVQANVYIDFY